MDRFISLCHDEVKKHLNKREIAIDMTVGRGNDTQYLCSVCKRVYGFDTNSAAIVSTDDKLEKLGIRNYRLICEDCQFFDEYVFEKPAVIMYHLGHFDNLKDINVTESESIIKSLEKALKILKVGGLITVLSSVQTELCMKESAEVLKFCQTINPQVYDVMFNGLINFKSPKPFLLFIKRKR